MSSADPSLRPGHVIGGRYRIEQVIGQGTTTTVASARHVDLDELVAVKMLLPKLAANADARARFTAEARAAAKIKSEYVVRVTDVGAMDFGTPFMVMELLDGEDLAATIARRKKLPISEAIHHVLHACEGIRAGHALGIFHGDIKPANLFLAKSRGRPPTLKVLDFGISKFEHHDRRRPEAREILGSPWYTAPEQLGRAHVCDARSDVWALGVVLHELVTGEVPFSGASLTEVIVSVLQEEPSLDVLPAELEPIVRRCLAKAPDSRPRSTEDLAASLRALIDTQSAPIVVAEEPVPSTERSEEAPITRPPNTRPMGLVTSRPPKEAPPDSDEDVATVDESELLPSVPPPPPVAIATPMPLPASEATTQLVAVPPRAPQPPPSRTILPAILGLLVVVPVVGYAAFRIAGSNTKSADAATTEPTTSNAPPPPATLSAPPPPIAEPTPVVDAAAADPVAIVDAAPAPTAAPPPRLKRIPTDMEKPVESAAPHDDDDPGVAMRVSRKYYAEVKDKCWDPTAPTSLVTVAVTTTPDGSVSSASATSADAQLAQCVEAHVKGWSFPPSSRPRSMQIPIRFRK